MPPPTWQTVAESTGEVAAECAATASLSAAAAAAAAAARRKPETEWYSANFCSEVQTPPHISSFPAHFPSYTPLLFHHTLFYPPSPPPPPPPPRRAATDQFARPAPFISPHFPKLGHPRCCPLQRDAARQLLRSFSLAVESYALVFKEASWVDAGSLQFAEFRLRFF